MLHTEAVSDNTLGLIKKIQSDPFFEGFMLVGGTALALQIGHRISDDIDFFTRTSFDNREALEHLEHHYGFREEYRHSYTLKGIINGIFTDFLKHDYDLIADTVNIESITMASKPDIAAMKVNAITGNGTRVKDFIDIYFLLKEYSFSQIIDFYRTKYKTRNDFHAVKSLTYFDDVIEEDWPKMILEKELTFANLKKEILRQRDLFLQNRRE
jgi:hypothetical protein